MKTGPDRKHTQLPSSGDPFHLGGPVQPAPKGSMAAPPSLAQARMAAAERALAPPPKAVNTETSDLLDAIARQPATHAPEQHFGPGEQTAAPTPQRVTAYQAEGDPSRYEVDPDGSITIKNGGEVMGTVSSGSAYNAIMGQIASGQLQPASPDEA